MPRRSPARFLAPLALVGFAVALVLVIGSSRNTGDEEPATPTTTIDRTADQREQQDASEDDGTRKRRRRTYTVEAGDTPSGIAEKTGVSLETIVQLNPDLDPEALTVGDKIRIR